MFKLNPGHHSQYTVLNILFVQGPANAHSVVYLTKWVVRIHNHTLVQSVITEMENCGSIIMT